MVKRVSILLIILLTCLTLCNLSAELSLPKTQEVIYITYLPFEIKEPGTYVLAVNWYANTSVSCLIEIKSSDVILYGNDKVLKGDHSSESKCLYIHDVSNITIYLPIIENWEYGILIANCCDTFIIGDYLRVTDMENATLYVRDSTYTSLINLSLANNSGILFYRSFKNEIINCTLDGKPIAYYEGLSNLDVVNIDLGQLIVVNCSNIAIKELELTSSAIALIEVSNVIDCLITNVTTTGGGRGILLIEVINCTVSNCIITSVDVGLGGYNSKNITINDIIVSNAKTGIYFSLLEDFIVTNSIVSNCSDTAMLLYYSENGYIYLNDFINNSRILYAPYQAMWNVTWHSPRPIVYGYENTIHVGYLGNYYSDYTGSDDNGDGVGESPYKLYEEGFVIYDFYPLIKGKEFYHILHEEVTLSHIPGIFIINGVFNATFIVGDRAASADVIGAIRIAESFRGAAEDSYVEAYVDTYVSEYVNGSVIIHWSRIVTPTIICVGGPGVNYLAYKYNNALPFYLKMIDGLPHICSVSGRCYISRRGYDYAIIALVEDQDKYILIAWGLTRYGTQAACIVLQNYVEFSSLLQGRAIIIKWTDINGNMMPDRHDMVELVEKWP